MQSIAKICFCKNANCFAHYNLKFLGDFRSEGCCVEMTWEDKNIIIWCINTTIYDENIGLNSSFAYQLKISEWTVVNIKVCPPPPVLQRVFVMPNSNDDYEILEANAERLQLCLLDQIKVVNSGVKMVIWVSLSLPINIKSMNTSFLKENTEVVVIPLDKSIDTSINSNSNESSIKDTEDAGEQKLNYFITNQKLILSKFDHLQNNSYFGRATITSNVNDISIEEILFSDDFVVYVEERYIEEISNAVFKLCVMLQTTDNSNENDENSFKQLYVKVKHILLKENIDMQFEYFPMFLTEHVARILNIGNDEAIYLEKCYKDNVLLECIEISPVAGSDIVNCEQLESLFKSYVLKNSDKDPILLNNGIIIELENNISCQINLHPKSLKYSFVDGSTLRQCKILSNESLTQPYDKNFVNLQCCDLTEICTEVPSFTSIVEDCVENLKTDLVIRNRSELRLINNKSHIFIVGTPGSGKSTLCNIIISKLGFWSTKLSCKLIKGRKDILELFKKNIEMCERHCPSVLICDDIEAILPCEVEGTVNQDANYYESLTSNIMKLLHQCKNVSVLLTTFGMDAVHSDLKNSKGDLVYTSTFTIPELNQDDRFLILKRIIKNSVYSTHNFNNEAVQKMAIKTSGYTARDLVDYVKKIIFRAVKKSVLDNTTLEIFDMSQFNDEDKNKYNTNIWEDIGGLSNAKKSLTEVLYWPLKYPNLFPKQLGAVLLYGPPGTGKSLLGACISKMSSVSFICVKGPELLSKYIGQSEQAVRNIFKSAEKKKPCVLFFDEFDSLAPRRGHDSTGVTDRVVNQLLTQLDGVEGAIKGVTVMAATSRPDLLDGALLRPGRFDSYIHCALPTSEERVKIFEVLSSNLHLSEDVDLHEMADISQNFTGADIKSVLSTAQLTCLEERLEFLTNNAEDDVQSEITVTQKHLLDAFNDTRPSLTVEQLKFYDRIYSRFFKKSILNDDPREQPKQRATLA